MTNLNPHPHRLQIGDRVTSDFYEGDGVYTITLIRLNANYGSAWRASVNDWPSIDAAWFVPMGDSE